MATINIDRSVEFFLDDGIADENAFRTSLGVDSWLRVHSEHVLAKNKNALGLRSAERDNGYVALSFAQIHFALLRGVDLSAVKDRNAGIFLRPHTLGMALATLKGAGGLILEGKTGFGALLKEISRAAASATPIKVADADVIAGATVGADTWMSELKIGMLLNRGRPRAECMRNFRPHLVVG